MQETEKADRLLIELYGIETLSNLSCRNPAVSLLIELYGIETILERIAIVFIQLLIELYGIETLCTY